MKYKANMTIDRREIILMKDRAEELVRRNFGREIGRLLESKLDIKVPEVPADELYKLPGFGLLPKEEIETEFIFMTIPEWEEIKRRILKADRHLNNGPELNLIFYDVENLEKNEG